MPRAKVTPTSPGRFALVTPLRQETHDLLRYVQDLLGAQVAPGDVDAVLFQALSELARKLEQRKFAATEQPRRGRHSKPDSRHIPAESGVRCGSGMAASARSPVTTATAARSARTCSSTTSTPTPGAGPRP